MKKNLGNLFLILGMLWHVELFASTYVWSSFADKTTALSNEAIYLKYVCEFSDRGELFSIDFSPAGEYEKYSLKLLSQREQIVDNKRVNSYEFVAFVKVPGQMAFDFDMSMKKTTKDSIENTVLGRDNVEKEEFSKKLMRQDTINVEIKEANSALVGDFHLSIKKDEPKVNAYEPYHLELIIEGVGNFEALKEIEFNIAGAKVFSQKAVQKVELEKDGYRGVWSQKFAIVSEKDFEIPQMNIEYFNIKDKKIDALGLDVFKVKVEKLFTKEELLEEESEGFHFTYAYVYYILTFIAGFLVAKIRLKQKDTKGSKDGLFKQKVQNAKSLGDLAMILALEDSKKYEALIIKIETKEVTSLVNVKKDVLN
ncbi:BatD family protein [bacterium]|nr:BatD family protein [bacterium]MBU1994830.1 BatD family protein [bacterium]